MTHSQTSAPSQEESRPRTVEITIHPTGRLDLFAVKYGADVLVKSSRQPRCDAARTLRDLGFPDDTFIVSRRAGSDVVSMQGRLGDWRKLRIKQGRNGPEFATYEAFPCARVEERRAKTVTRLRKGTGGQSNAPSLPPGAADAAGSPAESIPVSDAPALAPNEPIEEKSCSSKTST
jgi:hypothetical protein